MQPRNRRVQRIHLPEPIHARLGTLPVMLVDISVIGARVEHQVPLAAGGTARFSFAWEDQEVVTECRIVRSRLERFSVGADGLIVYHSGLEFREIPDSSRRLVNAMIGRFITRALEEQKLNAHGVPPPQIDRFFRLASRLSAKDSDFPSGMAALRADPRRKRESGYVCYNFENRQWRKKRTHDPGQPMEGFTISASEDHAQADLLCEAYEKSDRDFRRIIQLCAQLSIQEGEGIPPGRFEP
ncbi:MAG TPA: PilZ domain-containing protein [Thermoanaerobaculia bacterium]|nr:PilZ domain-containing protein [Thermoanaerobaculia bacterium]